MEITEQRLMEVFGLEGGKEQEPAEPAEEPTEDQEPEEDLTDGETAGNESDDEPAEEQEPVTDTGSETNGQSEEERREHAARRRQAEQQAAIQAAVEAERERMQQQLDAEREEFFRTAGVKNPYTGEPITNMDEFREWQRRHEEETLQKELKSGKLTEETLSRLIDRNPTVQALQEAQAAREQEAERARQEAFSQEVDRQMEEIRKLDPNIKEVGDLMTQPYRAEFYQAVGRGLNFLDAFLLATRKQETQRTAEAAKQAAINNVRSKDHLRATSIGGRPGATVSGNEMKYFKLFNPKATEQEIQKFVNKTRKE